jgi:hypothetical protein
MAVIVFAAFSSARSLTGSITIVNNSSRSISHVYLSHTNADDWGSDQLNGAVGPGQSFTINNINWDQPQLKVIGEDQDGCFMSTVVDSNGSVTWTVTDSTSRNCGGN